MISLKKRKFFGIPNALNVISNFPLLAIGLVGLMLCHHRNYFKLSLQGELWGWICFYVGVAAVAFGSSYYHLKPDDARLVWDRLPMTVAFPSMMVILIIERIDEKKGMISIVPLLMASIMSIVYWRIFDDIRLYVLVQFVSCIAIPLMAILLPPMYTHSTYWLWAAGFYPLALLQDATDKVIYEWTHLIVSGHTLKHLSAAMVPVVLTIMLAKRSVNLGRLLHNDILKLQNLSFKQRNEYRKSCCCLFGWNRPSIFLLQIDYLSLSEVRIVKHGNSDSANYALVDPTSTKATNGSIDELLVGHQTAEGSCKPHVLRKGHMSLLKEMGK